MPNNCDSMVCYPSLGAYVMNVTGPSRSSVPLSYFDAVPLGLLDWEHRSLMTTMMIAGFPRFLSFFESCLYLLVEEYNPSIGNNSISSSPHPYSFPWTARTGHIVMSLRFSFVDSWFEWSFVLPPQFVIWGHPIRQWAILLYPFVKVLLIFGGVMLSVFHTVPRTWLIRSDKTSRALILHSTSCDTWVINKTGVSLWNARHLFHCITNECRNFELFHLTYPMGGPAVTLGLSPTARS